MGSQADGAGARFQAYVAELASVIGHADRVGPLADYCTGLILPGERKSVEPMAARTAPARVAAQHQSLLHFVGVGGWSDERVLAKVTELVLPAIEKRGSIEAWIIDDTSFPKRGEHSVGVQHQYCGQLGKEANCQVAVSLSIANHYGSLPVGHRLYLPKEWADDAARREKTGVPAEIGFKTKQQIALELIQRACGAGLPPGVVLMDADYGRDGRLRRGITVVGLRYVGAIQPKLLMWAAGTEPRRPAKPLNNTGRRDEPALASAKQVALGLGKRDWRGVRWREGSADWLRSRFARVRVRVAQSGAVPASLSEEWLLIEWPKGEAAPTGYWLSTLPADISLAQLVDVAKMRWRIERDYQDLKQEVGLDHYEGRGWRGFHHHVTLCIASYGFLLCERAAIPPSGARGATLRQTPPISEDYRPRGSALAA